MGMVKKSITVTQEQDNWIKAKIASGNYGNESEVFRDLIHERVNREAEIEAIRTALIEGEQSRISNKTPEDVRIAVQERLRKNGQLPSA